MWREREREEREFEREVSSEPADTAGSRLQAEGSAFRPRLTYPTLLYGHASTITRADPDGRTARGIPEACPAAALNRVKVHDKCSYTSILSNIYIKIYI